MLTVKGLTKIQAGERVLNNVSFSLGEGQKAALVGENGVGKSTLLRILAGTDTPDRGQVTLPNRVLLGFLPQEELPESDERLLPFLRRMAGLGALEREMQALEASLDIPENHARFEILAEEYRRLGGYDFDKRAKRVLRGLRLEGIDQARRVNELSGGERRKAALAGVLLRGVDLLLLDEPTNNLDLSALRWLENHLKHSHATVLVASHDRSFLDNLVEKVFEIDRLKRDVSLYPGNWSDYDELKRKALRKYKEEYQKHQEEKGRLAASQVEKKNMSEAVWDKKRRDADKMVDHYKKERAAKKFSATAKVLERRIKRMGDMEPPRERPPLEIEFAYDAKEAADLSLRATDLVFGYQGGFSAGPVTFEIPFGAKVALLGDNGAGKTTLLKTLLGTLPSLSGRVEKGAALAIGYLMQEHEQLLLGEKKKVRSYLREKLPSLDKDRLPFLFALYHLPFELLDSPLSLISPGERIRVLLLVLVEQGINTLLLDEPTNHLDLESIEALEEAVRAFPGTVLLVTHDRRFLEHMELDQTLRLEGGRLSA